MGSHVEFSLLAALPSVVDETASGAPGTLWSGSVLLWASAPKPPDVVPNVEVEEEPNPDDDPNAEPPKALLPNVLDPKPDETCSDSVPKNVNLFGGCPAGTWGETNA